MRASLNIYLLKQIHNHPLIHDVFNGVQDQRTKIHLPQNSAKCARALSHIQIEYNITANEVRVISHVNID